MKDSVRIAFEVLAFVCVVFLIMQNFYLQEQIHEGRDLKEQIFNETKRGALLRDEILNETKQGALLRNEILKEVKNICKEKRGE